MEIVTEDEVYWAGPPDREEAGSPNVIGAVAMAAACKALTEIGMDRLAAHEADLTRYALTELRKIEGIEIYGDADPANASNRLGVIPFNLHGLSHYLVAAVLSHEYGIGVRNGCFCAHPYVLHLMDIPEPVAWSWRKQVVAGMRAHLPGLVRISFGCYNTEEEVDWLVHALRNIAAGEIAGDVRAGSRQRRVSRAHVPPGVGAVSSSCRPEAGSWKLEAGTASQRPPVGNQLRVSEVVMGFLDNLRKALGGQGWPEVRRGGSSFGASDPNAYWIYAQCRRCGEPLRSRVNLANDPSLDDDGDDLGRPQRDCRQRRQPLFPNRRSHAEVRREKAERDRERSRRRQVDHGGRVRGVAAASRELAVLRDRSCPCAARVTSTARNHVIIVRRSHHHA